MAKKKATSKSKKEPVFDLSNIAKGKEQNLEIDKEAVQEKKKSGRPKKKNKVEIKKILLRIPENMIKKIESNLETDEITGKTESRNTYILRAIGEKLEKEI